MNKRWLGIVFVLAAAGFSLAVYGKLPDMVATHFGPGGEPDGWSSRGVAAFGIPALALAMFALFNLFPRILPRRENFEKFEDTYWLITTVVIAYVCALHVVLLGIALGWNVSVPTVVLLGIGSMFVILGNLMPRVKSNWLLGIRTPWTLESEAVWNETHRLAGRTMGIGGVITMIAAFLPARIQPWIGMGGLLIGAFIPVIYSYILWRRERQNAEK